MEKEPKLSKQVRDLARELERHERVKRERSKRDMADRALHHRARRILSR